MQRRSRDALPLQMHRRDQCEFVKRRKNKPKTDETTKFFLETRNKEKKQETVTKRK